MSWLFLRHPPRKNTHTHTIFLLIWNFSEFFASLNKNTPCHWKPWVCFQRHFSTTKFIALPLSKVNINILPHRMRMHTCVASATWMNGTLTAIKRTCLSNLWTCAADATLTSWVVTCLIMNLCVMIMSLPISPPWAWHAWHVLILILLMHHQRSCLSTQSALKRSIAKPSTRTLGQKEKSKHSDQSCKSNTLSSRPPASLPPRGEVLRLTYNRANADWHVHESPLSGQENGTKIDLTKPKWPPSSETLRPRTQSYVNKIPARFWAISTH